MKKRSKSFTLLFFFMCAFLASSGLQAAEEDQEDIADRGGRDSDFDLFNRNREGRSFSPYDYGDYPRTPYDSEYYPETTEMHRNNGGYFYRNNYYR